MAKEFYYDITCYMFNDTASTKTTIKATSEGEAASKLIKLWKVREIVRIKKRNK